VFLIREIREETKGEVESTRLNGIMKFGYKGSIEMACSAISRVWLWWNKRHETKLSHVIRELV